MRAQIVRLTVLASLLATTLLGIPLAIAVAGYLMADERRELQQVADKATIAVSADLVRGRDTVELPATEPGITLGIYDRTGRLIAGRGPSHADAAVGALLPTPAQGTGDGGDLVAAVPAIDAEQVIAVVRAATPKRGVYLRTALTWMAMGGIGAAAVVTSWLLARRKARRLAQPLEALSAGARRLGDGDFSVRTSPSRIAEIDAAGAALNSTAARLDALVARERAFTDEASHQLRTPLTGLRLGLEAALEAPDGDQREAIGRALTITDRLEQTIDDLLALARDTSQRINRLDLPGLLTEIDRDWSRGPGADRPLKLEIRPHLPASRASTAAVRQILGVLVDNAVQHGSGTVTLTARDAGDALALDISDEGPGIARDATDPFNRRTDPTSGHGIGLAMARRLAEAEAGRLELTRASPPTFTLLLPGESESAEGVGES